MYALILLLLKTGWISINAPLYVPHISPPYRLICFFMYIHLFHLIARYNCKQTLAWLPTVLPSMLIAVTVENHSHRSQRNRNNGIGIRNGKFLIRSINALRSQSKYNLKFYAYLLLRRWGWTTCAIPLGRFRSHSFVWSSACMDSIRHFCPKKMPVSFPSHRSASFPHFSFPPCFALHSPFSCLRPLKHGPLQNLVSSFIYNSASPTSWNRRVSSWWILLHTHDPIGSSNGQPAAHKMSATISSNAKQIQLFPFHFENKLQCIMIRSDSIVFSDNVSIYFAVVRLCLWVAASETGA